MNKHSMQVTMPLEELERMQAEIERLKKKDIRNYFEYVFPKGFGNNDPYILIDQEKLIKDIAAGNEEVTTINVRYDSNLAVHTFKVNGGDDNATNN